MKTLFKRQINRAQRVKIPQNTPVVWKSTKSSQLLLGYRFFFKQTHWFIQETKNKINKKQDKRFFAHRYLEMSTK